MGKIIRNPLEASEKEYDLIIIGGGIYGVSLALVAAQGGLRALLLERDDFGGATTFNSLRIVHGGLRYLQKLDLHRFFESVSERRWFFQHFPGLVEPIPCLMPLYGEGLRKPSIFRVALWLNDLLSANRNRKVPPEYRLHSGKLISAEEVKQVFPLVDEQGLKGGAVWYDGSMADSQLIIMEMLKWACSLGATALNYCEAKELIIENGIVRGVVARDESSSSFFRFRGKTVVNTAGPWCRQLGKEFDKDYPELFHSSIAWNLLFDREALSDHALAITPRLPGAQTYFLRPWKGKLFAGTIHEPWDRVEANPKPAEASIQNFIANLNHAIPNLNLKQQEIIRIYSGLLPAKREGTNELAVREVILNHGENGGPKNFYSVSGVKFTTARLVAEKTLRKIYPDFKVDPTHESTVITPDRQPNIRRIDSFDWQPVQSGNGWITDIQQIIESEAVVHLDDLVFRRTGIGDNPARALEMAPQIQALFTWDEEQKQRELQRLKHHLI
ncbi:MAG: hypothetical protein Kow0042_30310 [Calditrichia bacterium]